MNELDRTIYKFVAALDNLEDGERAKFKRNAGQALNDSRDVLGLFYNKLLRDLSPSPWQEETFFLVATLYPFDKRRKKQSNTPDETDQVDTEKSNTKKHTYSFGLSLRGVRNETNSNGLDRRVERLLDADESQLPFYLRREVQYVTNEGGSIDWLYLLKDLLNWGHADRYVQRNWARDYFTYQLKTESTN